MRTRNFYFPNNSSITIPRRRNKRRTPNVVEPEFLTIVEVAPMADNRTMEELLQAPTEGYGEAIVIPEVNADHFEIKTNLLQLEMLRACPHHGFMELTQIDTFYNGLNENDQDSLNTAAGGNLLSKTTREALNIIENKSKIRYSRNKPNVSRMNTTSRENASKTDDKIDKLTDQILTLVDICSKKVVTPAMVKAVEESCVTCGGNHAYYNCDATNSNQSYVCVATGTYYQVAPQNRASNFMARSGFAPVQNNSQNSSFEGSDFILEEIEAYLKDDSISPEIDHGDYLKQREVFKAKCSIKEPPDSELKDLPSHLEYAYLEGVDKLPVIISKYLKVDEKEALLKVLKSHKRVVAWKITDIKGIDPHFCTHKILMKEDYKPAVQSQRRFNPKIHEVIKKEVIKLLDAGMIYLIYDSPWISPIHCVPIKAEITVVENKNNNLIHTRLVTGLRVCIDYRKLNDATRKDHFPLPFMDQMLERLAGNEFYCFVDGFSCYFQIPINPPHQKNTTFTCPYGTFAYRRMSFVLCNAPRTFQGCMMAIFHDMIEKTIRHHPSSKLGEMPLYGQRGPFTITKVFPYGTVKLSQPEGPNFKVNGHRVKHYFGGDIPQLVVSDLQTSPWTNEFEDQVKLCDSVTKNKALHERNHMLIHLSSFLFLMYGYYKNHKKRAKTGQKRTREQNQYARAEILSLKVNFG
uniref:Reverse transcriptase domain-containing protein n=1 Tax=Tanacetum cinerariifolium TaxID=118510 RepID=A0A699HCB6_TANCI|nr:reverse transcriptase domain-containing protein [Tanacetum cinerariifolium]